MGIRETEEMKELTQTRLESFIESLLNIGSGFILALLSWFYIIPVLFGVTSNFSQGLGITLFFTGLSIIRSFIWRRYFNGKTKKKVHSFFIHHTARGSHE